jgi:hypothetical protein
MARLLESLLNLDSATFLGDYAGRQNLVSTYLPHLDLPSLNGRGRAA